MSRIALPRPEHHMADGFPGWRAIPRHREERRLCRWNNAQLSTGGTFGLSYRSHYQQSDQGFYAGSTGKLPSVLLSFCDQPADDLIEMFATTTRAPGVHLRDLVCAAALCGGLLP